MLIEPTADVAVGVGLSGIGVDVGVVASLVGDDVGEIGTVAVTAGVEVGSGVGSPLPPLQAETPRNASRQADNNTATERLKVRLIVTGGRT